MTASIGHNGYILPVHRYFYMLSIFYILRNQFRWISDSQGVQEKQHPSIKNIRFLIR
jgi:hypothetical protein